MLPFNQTRIIDNSCEENSNPPIVQLEFAGEQNFTTWLKAEKNKIGWNLFRDRKNKESQIDEKLPVASTTPQTLKRGRPITIEWSQEYKCAFAGTPKPRRHTDGPTKRVATKPSRKVNCKASIKAQKKFGDNRIFVEFDNSHSGHGLKTMETWSRSRLSPALREWLQKVVATGIDWTDFKKMTHLENGQLELLEAASRDKGKGKAIEVSEVWRITNQDFNNVRRKLLKENAILTTR